MRRSLPGPAFAAAAASFETLRRRAVLLRVQRVLGPHQSVEVREGVLGERNDKLMRVDAHRAPYALVPP